MNKNYPTEKYKEAISAGFGKKSENKKLSQDEKILSKHRTRVRPWLWYTFGIIVVLGTIFFFCCYYEKNFPSSESIPRNYQPRTKIEADAKVSDIFYRSIAPEERTNTQREARANSILAN